MHYLDFRNSRLNSFYRPNSKETRPNNLYIVLGSFYDDFPTHFLKAIRSEKLTHRRGFFYLKKKNQGPLRDGPRQIRRQSLRFPDSLSHLVLKIPAEREDREKGNFSSPAQSKIDKTYPPFRTRRALFETIPHLRQKDLKRTLADQGPHALSLTEARPTRHQTNTFA